MSRRILVSVLSIFVLMVGILAPVWAQSNRTKITPENGSKVVELARLGRGTAVDIAFSPDGKTLAVAGTVGVWLYPIDSLGADKEPPVLVSGQAATQVAFAPDGKSLAVGEEGNIYFWTTDTRKTIGTVKTSTGASSLAFSKDSKVLAVGATSYNVILIDTASLKVLETLKGHKGTVKDLAFSSDGKLLVSGSTDRSVRLWDVAKRAELKVLEGHTDYVNGVAFSPDNKVIASASSDKMIRLWDTVQTKEIAKLEGHTESVTSVVFSPDGKILISGSNDDKVRLWELPAGKVSGEIKSESGDVKTITLSVDGAKLATIGTGNIVRLWDIKEGKALATSVGHTDSLYAVAFSPDSAVLSIGGGMSQPVWLWNVAEAKELNQVPQAAKALGSGAYNRTSVEFAPDGSYFVTLDGFNAVMRDPKTAAEIRPLKGEGLSNSVAISADSSLVVYVGSRGGFLFDAKTGKLLAKLATHAGWVQSVRFSPDQTLIATASDDGTARIYGLK